MRNDRGNALAVFIGIVVVVLIFLPVIIKLLQSDTQQAVRSQKSMAAFQLAESAIAKGVSKLNESKSFWETVSGGSTLTGFNGDREYTDVAGGSYKVLLTASPTPGNILIVGKGRDSASGAVRTIEAEYTDADPDAPALILNDGSTSGDYKVHWGSVKCFGNLHYPLQYSFPRLYSRGITDRDMDSSPPNTNNVDNWSFLSNMGAPPVPDFGYYREKAKHSFFPPVSESGGTINRQDGQPIQQNPPNSGYFQASLNPNAIINFGGYVGWGLPLFYEVRCSSCVIFSEVQLGEQLGLVLSFASMDVEAIISNGLLNLSNPNTLPSVFRSTIPALAQNQYLGTSDWGVGAPTAQSVWASEFATVFSQPNHCCYDIPNLKVHGFVYGKTIYGWSTRVVGVTQIQMSNSMIGDSVFYYDDKVAKKIVWKNHPLYRVSWKESTTSW